ncbi:hypothetical protein TYRP_002954 [Tyrophagus putrescentiae]|nr:hypothetical protein TYRP_002954 [Tyrophagus putrescentiae]
MSSTANNNSASNPGGRPSNTTRSAPNMAPDASSSANCDPAANNALHADHPARRRHHRRSGAQLGVHLW